MSIGVNRTLPLMRWVKLRQYPATQAPWTLLRLLPCRPRNPIENIPLFCCDSSRDRGKPPGDAHKRKNGAPLELVALERAASCSRSAGPAQYARIIAEETAKWRTVIARAGIKVD